jgi:hypothetical protein
MKRASSQLQIKDFSDREILAVMNDLNGSDDIVLAGDLTLRLFGLTRDDDMEVLDHAARCVTSRLAWMRRYGLVEKGEKPGYWAISEQGKMLRFTPLGRALSAAITNTPEASLMELTHQVSDRMLKANDVPARAMRREVQHQILRRKWR